MAAIELTISEIISDPTIRGGRPVIAGTGIRVADIVLWHTTGDRLSAEQIAEHFQLGLGQVYAALSYYHLHQPEIDTQIRDDAQDAEESIAELARLGRLTRFE